MRGSVSSKKMRVRTPQSDGQKLSLRPRTDISAFRKMLKNLLSSDKPFTTAKQSKWWVEEDLNLRPHAYQACALTT